MAKTTSGGMRDDGATASPSSTGRQPARHAKTGRFVKSKGRMTKRSAKRS